MNERNLAIAAAPGRDPEVVARCIVCDGTRVAPLCSRYELHQHQQFLERFHRRRLRPANLGDEAGQLRERADFTQDCATDLVTCADCGLVLREPQPSAQAVAQAYANDHYGRQRLEALFASHVELFAPRMARLRELVDAPAARPVVVEIGSYVGGFLSVAENAGWTALGIDPGSEVVAFCREKNLAVRQGTAIEVPVQSGSADVVAIWNTFDQLPDPRPTLAAARRWLRPGGVLALRVPNGAAFRRAMSRLHRLPRRLHPPLLAALAWNNLLTFPYLHGYSVDTLTDLTGEFGWRPLALDGDTLTRLADDHTTRWGAWEERIVKAAWRHMAAGDADLAPWLDMYFV